MGVFSSCYRFASYLANHSRQQFRICCQPIDLYVVVKCAYERFYVYMYTSSPQERKRNSYFLFQHENHSICHTGTASILPSASRGRSYSRLSSRGQLNLHLPHRDSIYFTLRLTGTVLLETVSLGQPSLLYSLLECYVKISPLIFGFRIKALFVHT